MITVSLNLAKTGWKHNRCGNITGVRVNSLFFLWSREESHCYSTGSLSVKEPQITGHKECKRKDGYHEFTAAIRYSFV